MMIGNSIEYGNDYLKTPRSLSEYSRDKPALTNAGTIGYFPGNGV